MHPIICKIGPFTVYSYGLMVAVAFLVSFSLLSQEAGRKKMPSDILFNLVFTSFISGVFGARIFYVIENISYYAKHPQEIIMLQQGGLSWFGGLIAASICAVIYLKRRSLSVYKFLDLLAPFIALAQGIGRIGCFLNGCCFGKESLFGIYFPVHEAVLIPTQLYSSFFLIIIFLVLRILQDRPHREGEIFFTYLFLYSMMRFFIEFWRADNPHIFLGLTLFQIISAVIFAVSCIKLFLYRLPRG